MLSDRFGGPGGNPSASQLSTRAPRDRDTPDGDRVGRGIVPRAGRRARFGVAAAVAVALFMALSPLTAATTTLSAPYRGSVTNGQTQSVYGCARAQLAPGGFSMHTGIGSLGDLTASARHCANAAGGAVVTSDGQATVSVEPWVHLSLPGGSHQVVAHVSSTWAASDQISTGSGCPAPRPLVYHYNYTYGNTTYWFNETGTSSYCAVGASEYAYVEVLLIDATNNTYIPLSSGSGCNYFYAGTDYCFAYSVNQGDSNYTSMGWENVQSTTCTAGNCSYYNYTYSLNSSYATPSTSFHGSGLSVLKPAWSYAFVSSHRYVLEIYGYTGSYADEYGWIGGHASSHVNVGTLGNRVDLSGVTIR